MVPWIGLQSAGVLLSVVGVLAGASAVIGWLTRCQHPNPHYLRPIVQPDDATRHLTILQPARYHCYECGKTWAAVSHDPAWTPTPLVQKFSGLDEGKALRAATRAAIGHEHPRLLAANRAGVTVAQELAVSRPRRRRRPLNLVDLNSRRRA
jgi:hypothetical protein